MSRTALTTRRYVPAADEADTERLRAAASRAASLREAMEAAELKKPKRIVEIDAPAKMDAGSGFIAGLSIGWIGGIVLLVVTGIHGWFGHAGPLVVGLYGAAVGSAIGVVVGGVMGGISAAASQPVREKASRKRSAAGRRRGRLWGSHALDVSQASRLSEIRLGMAHESLQNSLRDFVATESALAVPAYVQVPASLSAQMAVHRAQSLPVTPLSLVRRAPLASPSPRSVAPAAASPKGNAKRAA